MKYLAAFAPFHNEALNLPEWLAHHLNMGVEHFLLMEHQSTDDWEKAIAPFADVVTVIRVPERTWWPHWRFLKRISRSRDGLTHRKRRDCGRQTVQSQATKTCTSL